jgi:hypothetical protein
MCALGAIAVVAELIGRTLGVAGTLIVVVIVAAVVGCE